jgi:thiamine kinase-like enzyme
MADTPERCHGPELLFHDRDQGPFQNTRQLLDYFSKRLRGSCARYEDVYDSQPLVLTHNDLCMRNIIVGRDGKLWLVDWEWSVFYPPFYEYIAMKSTAINDDAPKSWCEYLPLVAGAWVREEKMLRVEAWE